MRRHENVPGNCAGGSASRRPRRLPPIKPGRLYELFWAWPSDKERGRVRRTGVSDWVVQNRAGVLPIGTVTRTAPVKRRSRNGRSLPGTGRLRERVSAMCESCGLRHSIRNGTARARVGGYPRRRTNPVLGSVRAGVGWAGRACGPPVFRRWRTGYVRADTSTGYTPVSVPG